MNTPPRRLPARPRQGIGALFVIAVGVIVVLAAIVGINQFGSLTQATRDTTAAIELTHKTTLVAESAVDEATYGTLPLDLNNPNGSNDGLYMKLRQWLPPANLNTAPQTQPPVFEGATPFIMQAEYAPKLTYDAMKKDETLKLASYAPESNPVYYGPLSMMPIVSMQASGPLVLMPESNESMGIMGFAHTARAKGAGFFKDLDQSVMFSRPYKCILIGAPWPYHRYALFVRQFFGEQNQLAAFTEKMRVVNPLTNPTRSLFQQRGPVKSAFAAFYRKVVWHSALVKAYKEGMAATSRQASDIPTAGINVDLNSPIVFEGDGSQAKLEPVLSSEPEIAALKADLPVPAGTALEDVRADDFIAAFGNATPDATQQAALDKAVEVLTKVGTSLKSLGEKIKVRNVTPADHEKYFKSTATMQAFNTVSAQAWMARATRIYKGPGDLKNILNKEKTGYQLDGVYYFTGAGPYTLDKGFSGKGILIFEDNVTVNNFNPDDPNDSHAVVVAVAPPGRSDPNSIIVAGDVQADLLAPTGTVMGPGGSPVMPTATIRGSVMVEFLPDALQASGASYFESGTPTPMFPSIDRGNKVDYEFQPPATSGGAFDAKSARHMQVFYDPGYVKKLYFSKRDKY